MPDARFYDPDATHHLPLFFEIGLINVPQILSIGGRPVFRGCSRTTSKRLQMVVN